MKNILKLAILTLVISSCLKKTNLEDPQVGPTENPDAVEQKMMSDVAVFAIEEMKKGEYSAIVQTRIVEDTSVTKQYEQEVVVSDIITSEQGSEYQLLARVRDLQSGATSEPKTSVIKQNDDFAESSTPLNLYYIYSVMAKVYCRQANITCHNLSVNEGSLALRQELQDPSICGNSVNCIVKTKTVTLDVLKSKGDGSRQKINYTFVIAPAFPMLSRVIKYCERSVVKASPRNYLEEICFNVSAFRPGTTQ